MRFPLNQGIQGIQGKKGKQNNFQKRELLVYLFVFIRARHLHLSSPVYWFVVNAST